MKDRLRAFCKDPLITLANSPLLQAGAVLALICTGAITFKVVEKGTFGDGVWWTLVTGTTVGYGDISPKSAPQRVIAGLIMLTSIVLIALLTSHLTNRLVRDDNVFTHQEQEWGKRLLLWLRRNVAWLRRNVATRQDTQQVMAEIAALREAVEASTARHCAGCACTPLPTQKVESPA